MVKKHGSARRVELILSPDPSESGAAALAMILSCYGKPAAIGELTGQRLSSAADLITAARARGLYAQGYRMSWEELRRAPMPLIAHWRFRSFVVVTGVRGGKIRVNSPEEGCQVLSRRAFEAGFTGVAICFATAEGEEAAPENKPAGEKPAGGAVWPLLAAAQLFTGAGYVALAILFRSVATQLASPQTGKGGPLCLLLGLVLLLQAGAAAFQGWLIHRCGAVQRDEELQTFCDRVSRESSAFFARTDLFYLDEAARGCTRNVSARSRRGICRVQLASGAICLLVMGIQNLPAAAVALLVAAVFGGICLARRERLYSDAKLCDRSRFQVGDRAARDLASWAQSRLMGENAARFGQWVGEAGGAFRPAEAERQKAFWYVAAAAELLLVFAVCLIQMIGGMAGTEDLLGCMALTAAVAASLGAIPCLLGEEERARQCLEDQDLVFRRTPDADAFSGAGPADTLALQNATLRMAEGDPVRDISFTVRRGEILVVTGEQKVRGALLSVLSGMERLSLGEMYLGSRNTAELGDREICKNIAILGNGIPFPYGTVRENIAAGFSGITDYAVMQAASDALLHTSILQRDLGYDTPVSTLSSGERILLEFARAFAGGTPFLVCNGLTGQLDEATEDQLIRNMRRRGVGAVLLTEDRALVRKGDIACQIQDGRTALRERTEIVGEGVYSLV